MLANIKSSNTQAERPAERPAERRTERRFSKGFAAVSLQRVRGGGTALRGHKETCFLLFRISGGGSSNQKKVRGSPFRSPFRLHVSILSALLVSILVRHTPRTTNESGSVLLTSVGGKKERGIYLSFLRGGLRSKVHEKGLRSLFWCIGPTCSNYTRNTRSTNVPCFLYLFLY